MFSDFESAVKDDICSGCGACAYLKPNNINIQKNKYGQLIPIIEKTLNNSDKNELNKVCPFSSNSLDREVLESTSDLVGDYIQAYAGYVVEGNYRDNGSSGGFGTWILNELISTKVVDAVIHVRESVSGSSMIFEFSISTSLSELQSGASSKYYPVSLDEVLRTVKESNLSFAIIAVPCFVRAIRNLQKIDEDFSRIKIIGSLYCGHLKTENYSRYIADSIKYDHGELYGIKYRVKADNELSSNYKTEIITSEGKFSAFRQSIRGTNWGLGLFKYKSCDFCEDISGELADFSLGDAWLPKYEKDDLGTNVIVVRHPLIHQLLKSAGKRLNIDHITEKELFQTQAGGYRHKREGIHVRNALLKLMGSKPVKSRYGSNERIKKSRISIYILRVIIRNYSKIYPYAKKHRLSFKVFDWGVSVFSRLHGLAIRLSR
ncbi:TPA: Coenzyme F420 hydrogenase/dehydrogenase, beta subunit C-terminal domain [Vibrio vulnificus]|nr:hypothetical protein [Vibrio vulnificus]HDY8185967.1 Coenzyme F420 hydrogenase/dehydrogenase, beta subunit C-terminal domain [Vibrio vulnificus]